MNEKLLAEATAALERGWLLTPLKGKVPILPAWQKKPQLTTAELNQFIYTGHNIGVRTGNGLLVVDCDPGTSAELLAKLSAISTPTVRTGRDGRHFYFAGDGRNSAGQISDHVDVRGQGGQVVLPASIHENGNSYTWIITPDEAELAPLPDFIRELIAAARKIKDAAPGTRNDTLNRAVFKAASNGAPTNELADAAIESGLTPDEIRATMRSASEAAPVRVFEQGEILVPGEHFFADGSTAVMDQTAFCKNVWKAIPDGAFYSRYGIVGELQESLFQLCESTRFRSLASKHLRLYAHIKHGRDNYEKEYRNFSPDMGALALAAGPEYVQKIEAITHYPLAGGAPPGWMVLGNHHIEPVSDHRAFWTELLRDFPLKDTNALNTFVCMCLTPLMRHRIDGPVPPFMLEATRERTGKTKLVTDVFGLGVYGRDLPVIAFTDDDTELDKRFFSVNFGGHTVTFFDNIRGKMDSSVFSSITTARTYQSRVLGQSKVVEFPVRSMIILTANNPRMSGEIAKRMMRIRLESPVDRPEMRSDFSHADLRAYIIQNRPRILGSLLAIAEMKCGKPFTLGGFEAWGAGPAACMDAAGMPLSQQAFEVMAEEADDESADVRVLIRAWAEMVDVARGAEEILALVTSLGVMPYVLDGPTERGKLIRMANALRAISGRVIDGYQIVCEGVGSKRQWRLSVR